jgi:hypothetical protein
MSKGKKKRRRNRSSSSGNGTRGTAHRQAAVGREEAAVEARRASSDDAPVRPRGVFGTRLRETSPYPSFADSMLRGITAASSSIPALAISFVSVFALWGGNVLVGAADLMYPKAIPELLALPPLHILFSDYFLAFSPVPALPPPAKIAIAVGFTVARGLVFGVLIALLASRLGWTEERPLRRWAKAIPHIVALSLAFFGVAAAIPFLLLSLLPGQLGQLVILAGPVVGLHFLAFAPVTAVLDGTSYRDAVRKSARAARLPGGSHLALTFGYFAFVLFLVSLVPQGPVSPATPTIQTWAIALGATFVHVGVLGAFVYRWLEVRDQVPEAAPARPAGRGARPGRGMLGRLGN